jgi:hypothetical protein
LPDKGLVVDEILAETKPGSSWGFAYMGAKETRFIPAIPLSTYFTME